MNRAWEWLRERDQELESSGVGDKRELRTSGMVESLHGEELHAEWEGNQSHLEKGPPLSA